MFTFFRGGKKPGQQEKNSKNGVKSEPVEVYCRLRPIKSSSDRQAIKAIDNESLEVFFENQKNQIYKFKEIFGADSSQADIFNSLGIPLVNDWFHGQNGKDYFEIVDLF